MVFTLQRHQLVPRPLDEVFPFFARPENLALITPPSLGLRILTPSPIDMHVGTVIDYTIRVWGMRVHWRSLITEYQPPMQFVDIQLRGPYAFWHHRHTFAQNDGGTVITDDLYYQVPLGILGRLIHRPLIRSQLRNIFAFREEIIKDRFG